MRPHVRGRPGLLVAAGALLLFAACSLATSFDGLRGGSTALDGAAVDAPDGTSPAVDAPAPADAVAEGGEASTDATGDDGMDAGGGGFLFLCAGNPTPDCASCNDHPLGCVLCGDGGYYAICIPVASSCVGTYAPQGYSYCPCAYPSPASCVIAQQECNSYNGGVCVTCGELTTDGFVCKGGGHCSENAATCL